MRQLRLAGFAVLLLLAGCVGTRPADAKPVYLVAYSVVAELTSPFNGPYQEPLDVRYTDPGGVRTSERPAVSGSGSWGTDLVLRQQVVALGLSVATVPENV